MEKMEHEDTELNSSKLNGDSGIPTNNKGTWSTTQPSTSHNQNLKSKPSLALSKNLHWYFRWKYHCLNGNALYANKTCDQYDNVFKILSYQITVHKPST